MRGQRINREVIERLVRRAVGFDLRAHRLTALGVGLQGREASHLALPEEVDTLTDVQTADGAFIFMADYSTIDGSDPIQ